MKLLVFALLVAYTMARPEECGVLQKLKVKAQWVDAYDYGVHREELNDEIWEHILHEHPEWKTEFFEGVRGENPVSPQFRAHTARISGAFDMAINLLMFEPALNAQLHHLGVQHKEMEIPAPHFDVFRHAVMDVVHHHVGRCYDYDAWDLCTKVISDGIQANMS